METRYPAPLSIPCSLPPVAVQLAADSIFAMTEQETSGLAPPHKLLSIDFSLLKEKYHPHRSEAASKIRACCGEIEECTNANINVDIPKRSDRSRSEVKFEIQGQSGAVQNAVQNIKQEFIIREKLCNGDKDTGPICTPADSVKQQLDKHQKLTMRALKKHDRATVYQLREFACQPCDHVWWRSVDPHKPVSRCRKCRVRYNTLPKEKEFGMGLFSCQTCGNKFKKKCTAQTICRCFRCGSHVSSPEIHPRFNYRSGKQSYSRSQHYHRKERLEDTTEETDLHTHTEVPDFQVLDPSTCTFLLAPEPHAHFIYGPGEQLSSGTEGNDKPSQNDKPTREYKKVIFPSTPHDSTGSTASSISNQTEYGESPLFPFDSANGRESLALNDPDIVTAMGGLELKDNSCD